MKITYGIINNNIDVTNICLNQLNYNNIITIPSGDVNRANIFSDPLPGILKKIFISINDISTEYSYKLIINIDTINNIVTTDIDNDLIDYKIEKIHSNLKIKYGTFYDELPEQIMAIKYLTGNEKVLEIGGNIGRNSLVIGYILNNNNNNFVTLESDPDIAKQLIENRDLNNLKFYIEPSALSKRKLIQKEWNTIVSDVLLDGYKNVNIISYEQLKNKYNINFDTLVLDCEGAFYYILMDMPEILNNIKLIIMENDYHNIEHKQYVDNILKNNNFYVDYSEAGGWGPCYNSFFQVWKKT